MKRTSEEDDTLSYKVKEVMEIFRLKHGEKILREDARTLFGCILSLYDCMKDEIVTRTSNSGL